MSAPDTNIDKQTKRHKPARFGIGGVLAFAAVLFAGLLIWVFATGDEPEGAAVQTDGRTGAEVAAD